MIRIPSPPYDEYIKNPFLNLSVINNTLTGEIGINCTSANDTFCKSGLKAFQEVNNFDEIDLTISLDPNGVITLEEGLDTRRGGGFLPSEQKILLHTRDQPGGREFGKTSYHEFGHSLGVSHRRNRTLSIMSYSQSRRKQFNKKEVGLLVNGYR